MVECVLFKQTSISQHLPLLIFSYITLILNSTQSKMATSAKQTVALISGANTGIGLATAIQLAQDHRYHVVIGSRNAVAGQEVAASLLAKGLPVSSVQLDISSDESIATVVSSIDREFGALDVLINNAGVVLDYNGLSPRELFTQTLSTNITGTACLTEACLPLLRKSKLPRVVFVSSLMGSLSTATNKETFFYSMDFKAYDSSKAAMNMLALNYARILDDVGGMVNAVCPGVVKTKMTNYNPTGTSTEVGAQRIVELATLAEGGPSFTFSNQNGEIPW